MFFKKNYLAKPSIITSDTILCATDMLNKALTGAFPTSSATACALDYITDALKGHVKTQELEVDHQRAQKIHL